MNITIMEDELVDRLKSRLLCNHKKIQIFPIPDRPDQYITPNIGPVVYVAYIGEQTERNQSTGIVSQHTTVSFQISYLSKFLRGNDGCYKLTSDILDAIVGFSLHDCGPLSYESQRYVNYENGIWEHEITVSCRSLRATIKDCEDEVFFNQLTIKNGEV